MMQTKTILAEIDLHIKNKNYSSAQNLCDNLLNKHPSSEQILLCSANIAHLNGNISQAISRLNTVLKHNNICLAAINSLAALYEQSGDLDNAQTYFEKAYSLTPDLYESMKNLAFFNYDSGHSKEARKLLQKLIINFPFNATAHFAYSRTGSYTREDRTLKSLQEAIPTLSKLSIPDQIKLGFTIGKVNHDIEEYLSAFAAFCAANQLHSKYRPYSPDGDFKLLTDVQKQFGDTSPWPLKQWQQEHHSNYPVPIFIVGMPRTGSTLLEQMIGTHSQVKAAGELNFLFNSIKKNLIGKHKTFNDAAPHWTSSDFKKTAHDYLENISTLAGNSDFVIDKMPGNFAFLGIIHLLFPNAKVIVTQRNAMDVVWSNFSTLFNDDLLLYTYKLESIAEYYLAYDDSIKYWQRFLASNKFIINSHESLVDQPEQSLKSIFKYLGLPWEHGCLNYRQSRTRIKTASHIQVKAPLTRSGIGRWRSYSKELESISALFEESGISTK